MDNNSKRILDDVGLSKVFELIHDEFYDKETIDEKFAEAALFKWRFFTEDVEGIPAVFYDKTTQKFKFSSDPEEWDTENWIPIGIAVVPAAHDIYGTGEAGVMSLVNMSWKTPDIGDINESNTTVCNVLFGATDHGLETTFDFPSLGACNGPVLSVIIGHQNDAAMMPTDKNVDNTIGPTCPTDNTTHYAVVISDANKSRCWTPSPYGPRNTKNSLFTEGESNALTLVDGKGMTSKLIDKITKQDDWQTADTIENKTDSGYYPAFATCWRFHTEGTKQGDWYLPEIGELAYLPPRFQTVDDLLAKINEKFGSIYATNIYYENLQNYITSTPISSGSYRISTKNASLGTQANSKVSAVRAFIRIKP